MLSSNLPYIKSIRKTIHTTIWPNHVSNSNNNNNGESESAYNHNASSLKRPDPDAVSEPAVDKESLPEKAAGPNTQSCQLAGEQVKVVTPHPEKRRLTHPRPDSPLVEEARALKRQDVGKWERISEKEEEEEEESEDLADRDFDDEEEASDSVFEDSGDEEESGCSKSSTRCRRYILAP